MHLGLVEHIVDTVAQEDFQSGFAPSLYETLSILAADIDQPNRNQAILNNLLDSQAMDGSWGSDERIGYTPDRIITTLMGLYTLKKYNLLTAEQQASATAFLQRRIPEEIAANGSKKPIAFEALTVELLVKNHSMGIEIPFQFDLQLLVDFRNAKMQSKMEVLHTEHGTVHSVLDAISSAPGIDWEQVALLQEVNGSMGIYPSSTAALLEHLPPDSHAFQHGLAYLNAAMSPSGEFYPFYPSTDFERWWVLLALAQSPIKIQLPPELLSPVPETGIPVATSFSLPDVDTAAMKATTLLTLGYDTELDFLQHFYQEGVFQCYEREFRISMSANIHVLMAILEKTRLYGKKRLLPEYEGTFYSTLYYLLMILGDQDHFEDKWHLSDLYTTAHAVELFTGLLGLGGFSEELRARIGKKLTEMLGFLVASQHADGGFGFEAFSSVEETGYAIRAISMAVFHQKFKVDSLVLDRAKGFLLTHTPDDDPPLWLGKTLYKSLLIAEAQRLSGLAWIEAVKYL